MNTLKLLKNSMYRIMGKINVLVMMLIILPIMIFSAVYVTSRIDAKTKVVLITDTKFEKIENDYVDIEVMDEMPPISDLLLNKYAAYVEIDNECSVNVTTIKSESYKEKLETFFTTGSIDTTDDVYKSRGVGTNIFGFISAVLLSSGITLMSLYAEDRELKTFRRILNTKVNVSVYFIAQCIFTFVWLFVPTVIATIATKELFNVNMNFDLGIIIFLVVIIALLATTFALFVASVFVKKENGVLASSAIIVFACILSGCFYSFTQNNKLVDTICNILPLKVYMDMVDAIEKGETLGNCSLQFLYVILWVVGLSVIGGIVTKKRMNKGVY